MMKYILRQRDWGWSCARVRTKRERALNQEEVSLLDSQRKSKAQRKIKAETILLENSQHQSATISQNDARSFPLDWADVMASDQLEGMDLIVGSGWVKSISIEGENRLTAFIQPHL
jgi:hypothetical protein